VAKALNSTDGPDCPIDVGVSVKRNVCAGRYKGRKPTARTRASEVVRLEAEGLQRIEIARRTGIGIASVYRVLADARKTAVDRKVAA
jgi:DNA invertase Pin-like site-specific DNA recombinase